MVLYRDGEGLFGRPAPVVLRHAIEGVLAVLLAVQTARLVWAVVGPLGPLGQPAAPPPPAPRADLGVLARFDPFHRGGPAVVQDTSAAAAAASTLRLFGVRSGAGGGSAIIGGHDGRQAAYAVGEAVAPGVTLAAVAADHVILAANGGRTKLAFTPLPGGPAAAAYVPPPPVAAPAPAPVAGVPELNPSQLAAVAEAMAQYQRGAEARSAQGTSRP